MILFETFIVFENPLVFASFQKVLEGSRSWSNCVPREMRGRVRLRKQLQVKFYTKCYKNIYNKESVFRNMGYQMSGLSSLKGRSFGMNPKVGGLIPPWSRHFLCENFVTFSVPLFHLSKQKYQFGEILSLTVPKVVIFMTSCAADDENFGFSLGNRKYPISHVR